MVWKDYIVKQFDFVNRLTTEEIDLYGPYYTLLHDLFPLEERYLIAPQFKRNTGSMDYTISYVVFKLKGKTPIFFVEIKTFVALELDTARAAADDEMRTFFLDFSDDRLPQSKLIGISAMGTRFAVYEYTTNDHRLTPRRIIHHPPGPVTDTAPKGRWSDDIMEDSGEAKFRALVNEAKEMASAIGGVCEQPQRSPFPLKPKPSNMVWKNYIVKQFDRIDRSTTKECDLYGAYNTLLQDLFPAAEYYQVAPQFSRNTRSDHPVVSYVVLKWKTPIFFVEIKTFVALELRSARAAADDQMRAIFLDFSDDRLPQSKLIGINAMGTHFAVYEYTTNNHGLDPPRIIPHPDIVTYDTAPKGRWSDDIMEDSGEAKFKALVNGVKEMALAISEVCEFFFLRYSRPFTD